MYVCRYSHACSGLQLHLAADDPRFLKIVYGTSDI